MAKDKRKGEKLHVFKGREAKLNRAIFQILAVTTPLTIYDIHKQAKKQKKLKHTRYASVNKRVRALQETGYIKKTGTKKTKAGFKTSTYELTARAYLALLLNSINLNDLLKKTDETTASTILSDIIHAST